MIVPGPKPIAQVNMTLSDTGAIVEALSCALSDYEGTGHPRVTQWQIAHVRWVGILRYLVAFETPGRFIWPELYGLRFIQGPNKWADGPFRFCPWPRSAFDGVN